MKKHISYLLIILLFCSLFMAACAGSSETEQDQSGETSSIETVDEGIDEVRIVRGFWAAEAVMALIGFWIGLH